MPREDPVRSLEERRRRLEEARLFFVCEARPRGDDPAPLLLAALEGGADMLELREKSPRGDPWLIDAARPFREACERHGALFIVNDRPDLVEACGADGVHVGQEDTPVTEARRALPPDALLGLSTHSREQIESAQELGQDGPDYISVGPIWETPTKQGRPATGLELIDTAARIARLPWFAIGGIDTENIGDVVAAGARRVVVVRAIRDAADTRAASRSLRDALDSAAVA
jgi:thiamine-phosphate pyrophosphorylase